MRAVLLFLEGGEDLDGGFFGLREALQIEARECVGRRLRDGRARLAADDGLQRIPSIAVGRRHIARCDVG